MSLRGKNCFVARRDVRYLFTYGGDNQPQPPCTKIVFNLPKLRMPFPVRGSINPAQSQHSMVLDFTNTKADQTIEVAREFLKALDMHVDGLVRDMAEEEKQDVKKVFPTLKVSKKRNRENLHYPPFVSLKFEPADVKFVDWKGDEIDPATMEPKDVLVQATVWLRDIWEYDHVFYPRLFVEKCCVYSRKSL